MRLTELSEPQYDLRAKYAHYNKLLWDGTLPAIPIGWKILKNIGGIVNAKLITDPNKPPPNPVRVRLGLEDKRANKMLKPGSLAMFISPQYKRSEQALDEIMIHEMIHVYLLSNGVLSEMHGRRFEAEAARCGKIVGFKIPLKDSVEGFELADAVQIKSYGVVLIAFKEEGKFLYALMSEKALRSNLDKLKYRLKYAGGAGAVVSFFVVADEAWSKKALHATVQRTDRIGLARLADLDLVRDLRANGTLLDKIGE